MALPPGIRNHTHFSSSPVTLALYSAQWPSLNKKHEEVFTQTLLRDKETLQGVVSCGFEHPEAACDISQVF